MKAWTLEQQSKFAIALLIAAIVIAVISMIVNGISLYGEHPDSGAWVIIAAFFIGYKTGGMLSIFPATLSMIVQMNPDKSASGTYAVLILAASGFWIITSMLLVISS